MFKQKLLNVLKFCGSKVLEFLKTEVECHKLMELTKLANSTDFKKRMGARAVLRRKYPDVYNAILDAEALKMRVKTQ